MIIIFDLLLILFVLLLFYIDIVLINRSLLKNKFFNTKIIISALGTNIALVGATGDGKSTTGAAITNCLIEEIINKCIYRMNKIVKQLYFINFNLLENSYNQYLDLYENFDIAVINSISLCYKEDKIDLFCIDYLNLDSCYSLLRDYLLYYNIINFTKSFVYSKGWFVDRVLCRVSKLYDSSSIELRNVLIEKNFQLHPGLVIYDDEKSLERGNIYSNNKEVKISGSKEFYALLRNMMKELTYHVVMKQSSDDEVKQERLLINSSLMIVDRKEYISSFPFLRKLINIPLSFLSSLLKFYCFFYDIANKKKCDLNGPSFANKMKTVNFIRIVQYYTFMICEHLKAMSYLRVRCYRYYRADDVGKRNPQSHEKIVLYFPIQYAYGCINTYEYYDSAYPIFDTARKAALDHSVSKFSKKPRIDRVKKIFNERK